LKALLKPQHRVVIFDAGTNDSSAATLRRSLAAAKAAAGDRRLIVLTVLSPPRTASLNTVIRASGADVLDWQKLVRTERIPLDGMGIHPTAAGYAKRAALIADAIEADAAVTSVPVGATGRAFPTGLDSNDRPRGQLGGTPGQGTHSFSAAPNNWQSDNAVDIMLPNGSPLYAVSDGTVCGSCGFGELAAGTASRFAGMRFTLNADDGIDWYYAHLTRMAVRPGARVKRGQLVGYSGSANGVAHLHLGASRENPVDLLGLNNRKRA
jgi:murein DD-endopeptidase MepM/ murein hydrolase activator NlpD